MKRIITLFVALLLAVAAFAGCAAKEDRDEASAPDTAAASEPQAEAAASEPTEEPTEEPAAASDSHNSITVNEVSFSRLNEGTCLMPLQEIGFIVNGVLNADMQIKSNPDNLLSFVCELTLSAAVQDEVLVVVTENGQELMRYSDTLSLGEAGDNQFAASIVLPHPASGSYTIAWYVGGFLLAEESLTV